MIKIPLLWWRLCNHQRRKNSRTYCTSAEQRKTPSPKKLGKLDEDANESNLDVECQGHGDRGDASVDIESKAIDASNDGSKFSECCCINCFAPWAMKNWESMEQNVLDPHIQKGLKKEMESHLSLQDSHNISNDDRAVTSTKYRSFGSPFIRVLSFFSSSGQVGSQSNRLASKSGFFSHLESQAGSNSVYEPCPENNDCQDHGSDREREVDGENENDKEQGGSSARQRDQRREKKVSPGFKLGMNVKRVLPVASRASVESMTLNSTESSK